MQRQASIKNRTMAIHTLQCKAVASHILLHGWPPITKPAMATHRTRHSTRGVECDGVHANALIRKVADEFSVRLVIHGTGELTCRMTRGPDDRVERKQRRYMTLREAVVHTLLQLMLKQ